MIYSFFKGPIFIAMVFFFLGATRLFGQCPGPNPCLPGNFNNSYEQIDPSSISGAVFCSGQTRDFTIHVGPGTSTQAANGDIEYITLFFDFDCDGIFEYSVNDSCSYLRPNGCDVDLSVVAPIVTSATIFNGRAHLVYNTPTSDPCANLPGSSSWGDIIDFTITVNLPPEPVLTSNALNNTICINDSVTFTGTDGDLYEFYINGVSAQAESSNNTFTTSSLSDGDIVTVRAINNANGCDTISTGVTIQVLDPVVVTQPISQIIFAGNSALFSTVINDVDTYQWQVSLDDGNNFSNISNGVKYSGVTTGSLTISNVDLQESGRIYRLIGSNSMTNCPITSNEALLTVKIRAVITNRRITYRINKN